MQIKDIEESQFFLCTFDHEGRVYLRVMSDPKTPDRVPAKRVIIDIITESIHYSSGTTMFKPEENVILINCWS
ncbi:MAG: hypothetical protein US83_C0010G0007 [Candidatus Falkowbacteria bacterium GW2011_GWC2_38_22]|uniref:Uncharacterized protein n=1 Tax=Candidatus Falkowbacteria bacterium GW2011_GWE1_38_31 TaxID=1618638 RepID=A0A0G0JUA8_9BACT|nr:MAG: hypothetical protein US73_C0005G0007 [Candidatus Falkowbacteria bacterium GW2011_GWF2_38_1205]KKQ60973.1 MAG: hypothetical protein US83_C0010G0007 [Candidatus Falkowbacteria bacterium GW2011_GWC2_38_22]KKQ63498.1 MAG: hypothetical protein US84_C0006G0101 [Candidatus Falkowbacteria bacterium GW2011_GWF1_38_22]KKQ65431.1 MAG: hypothetical protein US87_C0007G0007 [Candidatus Falkowbacteria bacterium GW2011_GWE2_38_254]KKQ70262.1 MAG: hypothetical protein US91_C0006G0101 [Candidatus Falkowb